MLLIGPGAILYDLELVFVIISNARLVKWQVSKAFEEDFEGGGFGN